MKYLTVVWRKVKLESLLPTYTKAKLIQVLHLPRIERHSQMLKFGYSDPDS